MAAPLVDTETGEVVPSNGSKGIARLNHIKVRDRHRTDLGDIDALAESIREVGLLNPLTVTADMVLVAGQRRLEAVRKLGWATVDIRIVRKISDAAAALKAEHDENVQRKTMTPTELSALTDALLEIERPQASERKAAGQFGGDRSVTTEAKGKASERAAKAAGWSRPSYERVKMIERSAADEALPKSVRDVAADLLAKLTAGTVTPNAAADALRDAKVAAGIGTTTDRIGAAKTKKPKAGPPYRNSDSSPAASEWRRSEIRRLAAENYTSRQIGPAIGITDEQVRLIAKKHDISIPANAVVGKTRRLDSTRIIEQIAVAALNLTTGSDLIKWADLDASRKDEWVSSLDDAIKSLQTLKRTLTKELTRA